MNELILRNVLKTLKEKPSHVLDIVDSFSDNQFNAKKVLLQHVSKYLTSDSTVAILGCWYGSILVPSLAPKVKKIIAVDLDDDVVRIGKNKFFKDFENVSWSTGDVFVKELDYSQVNLVINTSCEHMRPMKEWPFWNSNCFFALQSNNMYDIEGHVNCVDSMEQFVEQLPDNSSILHTEEIEDSRGTRFLVIGKCL